MICAPGALSGILQILCQFKNNNNTFQVKAVRDTYRSANQIQKTQQGFQMRGSFRLLKINTRKLYLSMSLDQSYTESTLHSQSQEIFKGTWKLILNFNNTNQYIRHANLVSPAIHTRPSEKQGNNLHKQLKWLTTFWAVFLFL